MIRATTLPPQIQLARVVTAVCADLRARWATVLAEPRWAEIDASLERLAVAGAVPRLARELGDAESERLAALLMARWGVLGEATLPPYAAILAPVRGPSGVELTVVVDGLEAGWTASWHGPVEPLGDNDDSVRLVAEPSADAQVTVRIFGRTPEARTILSAEIGVSGSTGPGDQHDATD